MNYEKAMSLVFLVGVSVILCSAYIQFTKDTLVDNGIRYQRVGFMTYDNGSDHLLIPVFRRK